MGQTVFARALVFIFLSALAACSSDKTFTDANGDGIDDGVVAPNNVTVVVPTKPLGFVAGTVLSASNGAPLNGAMVSLFGGGLAGMTTTDEKGQFQFGPIAAGASFSLRFTAADFVEAVLPALTIDDNAGNFPTSNSALFVGPVALIPNTGTFSVEVVSALGTPVPNATVSVETAVRYFLDGHPRETVVVSAMTDADGIAKLTAMPDVRQLPPRDANAASLVINVDPVDSNADGMIDLRGATLALSGDEVLHAGLPPVIVLELPGNEALQLVASNVRGLLGPTAAPSVLDPTENLRLVFNKPIDRDSLIVDLRDENGATSIPAPFVVGVLGNVVSINPAQDLEQGKEYNVAVRVRSGAGGTQETFSAAAPFFGRVDPAVAVGITGRFRDLNMDSLWGDANDAVEFVVTVPIGRQGAAVPFRAKLWLALDLNGSNVIGDGQGELPPTGQPYPSPLIVAGQEPASGNGASASGFTRFFGQVPIALVAPLPLGSSGAAFEIRLDPEDNDGAFITDVSGRPAPERTTGTALLQ